MIRLCFFWILCLATANVCQAKLGKDNKAATRELQAPPAADCSGCDGGKCADNKRCLYRQCSREWPWLDYKWTCLERNDDSEGTCGLVSGGWECGNCNPKGDGDFCCRDCSAPNPIPQVCHDCTDNRCNPSRCLYRGCSWNNGKVVCTEKYDVSNDSCGLVSGGWECDNCNPKGTGDYCCKNCELSPPTMAPSPTPSSEVPTKKPTPEPTLDPTSMPTGTPGPLVICTVGYVVDTFCIQRGTLLDAPSIVTLENPEQHTLHCLVDVTPCRNSPYNILQVDGTSNPYKPGYYMTDNALLIAKAQEVGFCTNGCNGDLVRGLRLKVKGTVAESVDGEDYLTPLEVEYEPDEGVTECTPSAPTLMPTPAPTPAPTNAPTPQPTHMPTPAPTPAPTQNPTPQPTRMPTPAPTKDPTPQPTPMPTPAPTNNPTPMPTERPTVAPTQAPRSIVEFGVISYVLGEALGAPNGDDQSLLERAAGDWITSRMQADFSDTFVSHSMNVQGGNYDEFDDTAQAPIYSVFFQGNYEFNSAAPALDAVKNSMNNLGELEAFWTAFLVNNHPDPSNLGWLSTVQAVVYFAELSYIP